MFELAARKKFRFITPKGQLSAEDLFDLPLSSEKGASLDKLARSINSEVKSSQEESFVADTTPMNQTAVAKLEIVKRVITIKKEENAARASASEKSSKRQEIMGLIAAKKSEALQGESIDKLEAMLASL